MRSILYSMVLTCAAVASGHAQDAQSSYVEGLDHLRNARFAEAVASLTRAIEQDSENVEYRVARGATQLFAEKPEAAVKDLDRAIQLSDRAKEPRMWRAAADRMQAKFFTEIYPEATNDPFESKVGRVSAMWGQTFRNVEQGYEPSADVQAEWRAQLADLRRWFIERKLGDGAAAEVLWKRGKERCDRGQWVEAAPDIEAAFSRWPEDPTVLYYHASVRLGLGDLVTARREYTRVLTADTAHVNAYLGRSIAAARMGDKARAERDLESVRELNADVARANEAAIAKHVAAATWDPAFAAPRRRYDETYQDGLRAGDAALRRNPRDVAALADLAAWLYEHIDVPRERVEPRGEPRLFRHQTKDMQDAELQRAEKLCDDALAVDPACVKALVVKAAVRMWNMRYSDAETLLKRALGNAPTDADVLSLLSQVMDVAAAQKRSIAAGLRTPTVVGSSTRTEGDYEITTTWWRQPSQAELDRARQLEAEADACLRQAVAALEVAAKAKAGTAQGSFLNGVLARRFGKLDDARAEFANATAQDPRYVEAWFQLAGVCNDLGRGDDALVARAAGYDLIETTAAPHLTTAWKLIERTKFQSALKLLDEAEKHDAADARIAAFRGVALEADEKVDAARAQFERALAIERSRAQLYGTSIEPGDARAIPTELLGLVMTLQRRLAAIQLAAGDAAGAAARLKESIAFEPRLVRGQGVDDLPRALLPAPGQDPIVVPESFFVLAHVAWARVKCGEALLAQKSYAEAKAVALPVLAYGPSMINGKGSDRFREQELYTKVLLCRIALAEGKLEEARMLAQALPTMRHGAGPSKAAFPELEVIGQQLHDEVDRLWKESRERGDERWDEQGVADPQKAQLVTRKIMDESGLAEFARGDARASNVAAPFAAILQQAAMMIVAPKSNQWRENIRYMFQQVQEERDHTAEAVEQFGGRSGDSRFARRDDDAELYKRLLGHQDRALELLRAACVEHGYPADALAQDLGGKTGAPGPAPFTGDAGDPEAKVADACARAGVTYLRRTDRHTAAPESMLAYGLRLGVEAINSPKTAQWRQGVIDSMATIALQARQSRSQLAELDRRIATTKQRIAQQPRAARQLERQIAQLQQQKAEVETASKLVEKALTVLKEDAAKAGYPTRELDADLKAAGYDG